MSDIAKQSVSITFWATVEKVANMGLSFVVGLVLARLLSPGDYGVLAMFSVFVQIAAVFIECGFGNALIRKKNCSQKDYSTAFWFSFFVALACYITIFIGAPFIGRFYKMPLLVPIIRVYCITILLSPFGIVQGSILTRKLAFKKMAKWNTLTNILGSLVGIIMAYLGYGVWALVYSTMFGSVLSSFFLAIVTHWVPSVEFSKDSIKYLWGFGSKMLVTGIISRIYANIHAIVIGKFYSSSALGLFNRGQSLARFGPSIISGVFGRTTLPMLARVQNDKEHLISVYRQYSIISTMLALPIIALVVVLARPFVVLFLTEKWIGCLIFVYIFAISMFVEPASEVNLNLMQALGRSDMTLKAEIVKKASGFLIVIMLVKFGPIALAWGAMAQCFVAYAVNLYCAHRLIELNYWVQVKDFLPYIFAALIAGLFSAGAIYFIPWNFVKLIIGSILCVLSYFAITKFIMKVPYYDYVFGMLKHRIGLHN